MDIYLASGNPHKYEEFAAMLRAAGVAARLLPAAAAGGMPEVEESGATFADNARRKAEALAERVPDGAWVLADDSGLEVDALGGAPGVRSARYAGGQGDAAANNARLLRELAGVPPARRTARFRCVLCFLQRGGGPARFFSGACEGRIVGAPANGGGFGYDPLFQPLGHEQTFAQLDPAAKNRLSHRARAFAAWARFARRLGGQQAGCGT